MPKKIVNHKKEVTENKIDHYLIDWRNTEVADREGYDIPRGNQIGVQIQLYPRQIPELESSKMLKISVELDKAVEDILKKYEVFAPSEGEFETHQFSYGPEPHIRFLKLKNVTPTQIKGTIGTNPTIYSFDRKDGRQRGVGTWDHAMYITKDSLEAIERAEKAQKDTFKNSLEKLSK